MADKAAQLWSATADDVLLLGGISYRHTWVDMSNTAVTASRFTSRGKTCVAAFGYSFAAGTADGERRARTAAGRGRGPDPRRSAVHTWTRSGRIT